MPAATRMAPRPVIPFLLMQLRQGRGRPWKRQFVLEGDMARDLLLAFLEREQYIKRLEGVGDELAMSVQAMKVEASQDPSGQIVSLVADCKDALDAYLKTKEEP